MWGYVGYIYFLKSFTVQNRPPGNKIATNMFRTTAQSRCNAASWETVREREACEAMIELMTQAGTSGRKKEQRERRFCIRPYLQVQLTESFSFYLLSRQTTVAVQRYRKGTGVCLWRHWGVASQSLDLFTNVWNLANWKSQKSHCWFWQVQICLKTCTTKEVLSHAWCPRTTFTRN